MKRTATSGLVLALLLAFVAGSLGDPTEMGRDELAQAMDERVIGQAVENDRLLHAAWRGDPANGGGQWEPTSHQYATVTPNGRVLTIDLKDEVAICLAVRARFVRPNGWTLDLANSPTCNGHGGDANTTDFASELEFKERRLGIYGGQAAYDDRPGEIAQYRHDDFLRYPEESEVYIAVCDDKLLVNGPNGSAFHATEFDEGLGDEIIRYGGLFNLDPSDDGLTDTMGGDPPDVLYLGANRTVGDPNRMGTGLVHLELYALPSPFPADNSP